MPEFHLRVDRAADDTASLSWTGDIVPDDLVSAVAAAADEALLDGYRRLELSLPAEDRLGRRAALRAGFRLEGVRRLSHRQADGGFTDLAVFGRLATDEIGGPAGFSGVMTSALPKKRLIAHVLMRDAAGRVLLCDTQFKTDWELPGGIVEPGEPPRVGAAREVQEELGLDLDVGRLLVADWMPPYLGWEDALELIFDGGLVTDEQIGRYILQPSEIKRIALVSLDEARPLLTELAHRRLTIAAGLQPPATAYLENGSLPS